MREDKFGLRKNGNGYNMEIKYKNVAKHLINNYPGIYAPGKPAWEKWKEQCVDYGKEAVKAFWDILEKGPVIVDCVAIYGLRALGYQAYLLDNVSNKPSYEIINPLTKDKIIITSQDSYRDFDTMHSIYVKWLELD